MTDMTLGETPRANETSLPAIPAFDHAKYATHLDGLDLTEAQERAFLETLWSIMIGFVDLGWGVDSVQQIIADRAELSSEFGAHAVQNRNAKNAPTFNDAATDGSKKDDGHHE